MGMTVDKNMYDSMMMIVTAGLAHYCCRKIC